MSTAVAPLAPSVRVYTGAVSTAVELEAETCLPQCRRSTCSSCRRTDKGAGLRKRQDRQATAYAPEACGPSPCSKPRPLVVGVGMPRA